MSAYLIWSSDGLAMRDIYLQSRGGLGVIEGRPSVSLLWLGGVTNLDSEVTYVSVKFQNQKPSPALQVRPWRERGWTGWTTDYIGTDNSTP